MRDEARSADIPLIMLTARGHTLSKEDLARTNIQHLLPKPFSAREVEGLVTGIFDADTHRSSENLAA
jgi:DNA-binding response OmpR family regulator